MRPYACFSATTLATHASPNSYSRTLGAKARCLGSAVLTPDAVASMWVKREVTAALIDDEYNDRIVPLLAKNCDYEQLAWPLTTLQTISLRPFKTGIADLLRIWDIGYRS